MYKVKTKTNQFSTQTQAWLQNLCWLFVAVRVSRDLIESIFFSLGNSELVQFSDKNKKDKKNNEDFIKLKGKVDNNIFVVFGWKTKFNFVNLFVVEEEIKIENFSNVEQSNLLLSNFNLWTVIQVI